MPASGQPAQPTSNYCRLWGTRGSLPISGPQFVRHGGNTPCLEVVLDGQRVIIDAGTGIYPLGQELVRKGPMKHSLFISHTHWDHIQGFPFFTPIYVQGNEVDIHAPAEAGSTLKERFADMMKHEFFPVDLKEVPAKLNFFDLKDQSRAIAVGGLSVDWVATDHPCASAAYRVRSPSGKVVAYLSDNEFLKGYLGLPQDVPLRPDLLEPYECILKFCDSVDLLVAEAQYTDEEYAGRIGWGHSSLSSLCLLCKLSNVKKWVVIHHDPLHDDKVLDEKLVHTKSILRGLDWQMEVLHGEDGMIVPL
ncbi:MAG: MBL fold metallo-hydrolase [Phycisphaerae bacterium]|nr:MBL fold metallo-hydrolase [Phycisphaerae bacterium]MDW8262068.1 MBL fold metallo-hydrolase [Phycisphaerales bacterium]